VVPSTAAVSLERIAIPSAPAHPGRLVCPRNEGRASPWHMNTFRVEMFGQPVENYDDG
jgi:hypothetical protein